jgi:alkanesulfonate monooxygenase SsuD/methylene tetrahydromethanopterin reductase-like flavin-dependent oxidoreductase (luciferase family)
MKEEFDIYRVPFARRGKRMDECIEVIRKLWTGDMVNHHGEFYQFPNIILSPAPKQNPPIYIGGDNTLALERAAYLGDGWIGRGNTAKEAPAILNKLATLRKEAGRDHLPFETMVGLTEPLTLELLKPLRDEGMTSAISYPFMFALGERSSIDDKKRYMEAFANNFINEM